MRSQRSMNAPWTRWPDKASGFTLLELIVVMVIVAVLAAVAVPTVATMGSSRGAMAAKQLLRDVTFARQDAISTGVTTWFVVDASAETWSVLSEDASNPGRAHATILYDASTGAPFTQQLGSGSYYGVAITSVAFDSGNEVGFDWLGRPLNSSETDLAANGTIALNSGYTVTVLTGSGLAQFTSP